MRLVRTVINADNGRKAKVYYRHGWQDYVVKLYVNGNYIAESDYFTDDKEDASDTAFAMVHSEN